jgi:hypothetical protein
LPPVSTAAPAYTSTADAVMEGPGKAIRVLESLGAARVYVGPPGADLSAAGHASPDALAASAGSAASTALAPSADFADSADSAAAGGESTSWFDGLWQGDGRMRRFVLCLTAL